MKKIFILLLVSVCASLSYAQTNFRHLTHDEAIEQAKAEGKLVFFDFYTQWCGPCKMMAKNVFPQKEVGDYFNAKYVCVKLDAENETEGKNYCERYAVKAYPTFVVVDPKTGKVLYNHAGGNFNGKEFCDQIESGCNPALAYDKLEARYNSGERNGALISNFANSIMLKAEDAKRSEIPVLEAKAQKVVDDYFNSLSEDQKFADENIFLYNKKWNTTLSDPKYTFAAANLAKFSPEVRDAVKSDLTDVYQYLMSYALAGRLAYTSAEVKKFGEDVNKYGFNEDGQYNDILPIWQTIADGDDAKFIDMCEKGALKKLSNGLDQNIMLSFDECFKSNDKEILQRASKYIRNEFLTMEPNAIMFATRALGNIETRMNGGKVGH